MWNLPKGDYFLPSVSLSELQRLYRKEQKAKPKMRLLCAIHRKRGESIDDIAYSLSIPRRTVHGCLHRFMEREVTAKDSIKQPGKVPRLTLSQRRLLVRELERGPPNKPSGLWTTKEVRGLIREKFGVTYALPHVWRILTSCGFSIQRPRPRHQKAASAEEIKSFKKKRGDRRDTTERKEALLWAAKMRRRSVSSPTSHVDGHEKEAALLP